MLTFVITISSELFIRSAYSLVIPRFIFLFNSNYFISLQTSPFPDLYLHYFTPQPLNKGFGIRAEEKQLYIFLRMLTRVWYRKISSDMQRVFVHIFFFYWTDSFVLLFVFQRMFKWVCLWNWWIIQLNLCIDRVSMTYEGWEGEGYAIMALLIRIIVFNWYDNLQ